MSSFRKLDVKTEDASSQKWSASINEDIFQGFISQSEGTFEEGSLFSPLLFGKFFDPSDAFPLWDFESDAVLSGLRSCKKTSVDWCQYDNAYVLKAELSGGLENSVQVCVVEGKAIEISGQWKQHQAEDWRCGNWWEYGFVRKIELPEDADWGNTEAKLSSDNYLELRIPKKGSGGEGEA